jgi:transposase
MNGADAMTKVIYTADFKADAIRQVLELGHEVKEAAQRLCIPDRTLSLWVGLAKRERDGGADEVARLRAEGARLRSQLRKIKNELDSLREAAAAMAGMYK